MFLCISGNWDFSRSENSDLGFLMVVCSIQVGPLLIKNHPVPLQILVGWKEPVQDPVINISSAFTAHNVTKVVFSRVRFSVCRSVCSHVFHVTTHGFVQTCSFCSPYIYWQAMGWPSTERPFFSILLLYLLSADINGFAISHMLF